MPTPTNPQATLQNPSPKAPRRPASATTTARSRWTRRRPPTCCACCPAASRRSCGASPTPRARWRRASLPADPRGRPATPPSGRRCRRARARGTLAAAAVKQRCFAAAALAPSPSSPSQPLRLPPTHSINRILPSTLQAAAAQELLEGLRRRYGEGPPPEGNTDIGAQLWRVRASAGITDERMLSEIGILFVEGFETTGACARRRAGSLPRFLVFRSPSSAPRPNPSKPQVTPPAGRSSTSPPSRARPSPPPFRARKRVHTPSRRPLRLTTAPNLLPHSRPHLPTTNHLSQACRSAWRRSSPPSASSTARATRPPPPPPPPPPPLPAPPAAERPPAAAAAPGSCGWTICPSCAT